MLAYNAYILSTSPYQYAAGYYNGGWNTISTSSNTSDLNNWVHIVATYSGTTSTIYKNGLVIGTGTIGNNPDTSNLGKRWDMPDLVYGDYALVNRYNRALSLAEIGTNFNAVKSRFGF